MNEAALIQLLLVEDDERVREPLAAYLSSQGFAVMEATNAAEARVLIRELSPDLAVLDITMPGEDGLSLCRHLSATHAIPTIFLTGRAGVTDRVAGLEVGADDYVIKPFDRRELLARIRAVLRRTSRNTAEQKKNWCFAFDNWQLNTLTRQLINPDGAIVPISSAEFRLLLLFLRYPCQVLDRDRLIDMLHGRDANPFSRSVDNQVSRLRRKIEVDRRNPRLIQTVHGDGYMFTAVVHRIPAENAPGGKRFAPDGSGGCCVHGSESRSGLLLKQSI